MYSRSPDPVGPPRLSRDDRAALTAFKAVMLEKLRENSHKGHWSVCSIEYLQARVYGELLELDRKIQAGAPSREVSREAADVANFAMMIASNFARTKAEANADG